MHNKIFCQTRKTLVASLPEEIVRQKLLFHLINNLHFPESLIVLEKALCQMPHLTLSPLKIPDRRADIVCYAKGIHKDHDLYPLLIIECKAVKLTARVVNQVVGYNRYVKANFIAIANESDIQFGCYDPIKKDYSFLSFIPTYQELLLALNVRLGDGSA